MPSVQYYGKFCRKDTDEVTHYLTNSAQGFSYGLVFCVCARAKPFFMFEQLSFTQLVHEMPVVWVVCDQVGNWLRLKTRLGCNNLVFHGNKVPSTSAALGCVTEMIASLRAEDIIPGFSLEKSMSYTALMLKLEKMGLVSPVPSTPKGKTKSSDKESSLTRTHRSQVGLNF